jgi:hypothetical protein
LRASERRIKFTILIPYQMTKLCVIDAAERPGGMGGNDPRSAVLVAEHGVVVLPCVGNFATLTVCLSLCTLRAAMARFGRMSESFDFGGLGVAALARRAPDVGHSPVQVYVVLRLAQRPRELGLDAQDVAETIERVVRHGRVIDPSYPRRAYE